MYSKNRNILLAVVAIVVILVVLSPHATEQLMGNVDNSNDHETFGAIDLQNNYLVNYFNSRYNAQVSEINTQFSMGRISAAERNKQLNAVADNYRLTINTLSKLSAANNDILTGNITKQDIINKLDSINDLNSDIKYELNASLNN